MFNFEIHISIYKYLIKCKLTSEFNFIIVGNYYKVGELLVNLDLVGSLEFWSVST